MRGRLRTFFAAPSDYPAIADSLRATCGDLRFTRATGILGPAGLEQYATLLALPSLGVTAKRDYWHNPIYLVSSAGVPVAYETYPCSEDNTTRWSVSSSANLPSVRFLASSYNTADGILLQGLIDTVHSRDADGGFFDSVNTALRSVSRVCRGIYWTKGAVALYENGVRCCSAMQSPAVYDMAPRA